MKEPGKYLACLVEAGLKGVGPAPVPQGIEEQELVKYARIHHMEYLLLTPLLKVVQEEDLKGQMSVRIKQSMLKTCVQLEEYKRLHALFEVHGVKNQPMKGIFMKGFYPSPLCREMSDIDILIQEDCMDQAALDLQERGFTLLEKIHHHDIYTKKPYMCVEAHRARYDKTVDRKQYEYFKDFSKACLMEGSQYTYNFSDEDFYVYMMSHMAKHFYQMGCGIRNLVDIYIFRKTHPQLDSAYLKDQLEVCGIYRFTRHMEQMTRVWLENMEDIQQVPGKNPEDLTDKQREFYDNLFVYMLDSGIYGKDENGIWNEFAKQENETTKAYNRKLRKFYLFPPRSYMEKYYPWVEGKKGLLPLAWCQRAWHGLTKHTGKKKVEMLQHIDTKDIKTMQNLYKEMQFDFKNR